MSVTKEQLRKGDYYTYASGYFPVEQDFIEKFSEVIDKPYEESYNQVMEVMRVVQEMLLQNKRFMLPGIGVIGLAENAKKGIVVASSTLWWTPGLLNVIAGAPGWENAPLNTYLTEDNVHSINTLVANMNGKINLSPFQFYNASDFGVEGEFLSDEKMEFYKQAEDKNWKKQRKTKLNIERITTARKSRDLYRVFLLKKKVRKMEEQLKELNIEPIDTTDIEAEVKAHFEKGADDKV